MATALWSRQTILRTDETRLPEWSGKLGGVCGVSFGRAGDLGQVSLRACDGLAVLRLQRI
jgi:hypothetical protein